MNLRPSAQGTAFNKSYFNVNHRLPAPTNQRVQTCYYRDAAVALDSRDSSAFSAGSRGFSVQLVLGEKTLLTFDPSPPCVRNSPPHEGPRFSEVLAQRDHHRNLSIPLCPHSG